MACFNNNCCQPMCCPQQCCPHRCPPTKIINNTITNNLIIEVARFERTTEATYCENATIVPTTTLFNNSFNHISISAGIITLTAGLYDIKYAVSLDSEKGDPYKAAVAISVSNVVDATSKSYADLSESSKETLANYALVYVPMGTTQTVKLINACSSDIDVVGVNVIVTKVG